MAVRLLKPIEERDPYAAAVLEAFDRTETLVWHDAATEKPDSDMTVLCWDSEGFFCGYWDDSIPAWVACESGAQVEGVAHWSTPNGPGAA